MVELDAAPAPGRRTSLPVPGGNGLRPGALRPPARSWLTADRQGPPEARKARWLKAPQRLTLKAPQRT